ncbi:MAG TPA: ribosome maturation factor RimP [Terriglobales bacterium]|nr:ribosome maturation factor RimP [Terriglobales bacterium]
MWYTKITLQELILKVGFARFFCFWGQKMDTTIGRIWDLVAPLAANQGMEVVDIELKHEGTRGGRVLRIYLDKETGPNMDDLSQVSRLLSELLDTHDIVDGAYTLEVSSPGINRPLKRPEHFRRFVGKRVRVRTREMIQGRRSFLGPLLEVSREAILINQDGTKFEIPFSMIERSNYEHDWSA